MKRDMELVRELLIAIEASAPLDVGDGDSEERIVGQGLPARQPETLVYHLCLLRDAAFIEATPVMNSKGINRAIKVYRLTWDGHEFLDVARSDTIWTKAKTMLAQAGVCLSLEAMKIALKRVQEAALG